MDWVLVEDFVDVDWLWETATWRNLVLRLQTLTSWVLHITTCITSGDYTIYIECCLNMKGWPKAFASISVALLKVAFLELFPLSSFNTLRKICHTNISKSLTRYLTWKHTHLPYFYTLVHVLEQEATSKQTLEQTTRELTRPKRLNFSSKLSSWLIWRKVVLCFQSLHHFLTIHHCMWQYVSWIMNVWI